MKLFKGYDLDNLVRQPVKEAAAISRIAATEGLVLLKNNDVLPFDKEKTVSIFGRTQIDYVKSGTGSGGLVHVEYSVNILDGLTGKININQDLLNVYKKWLKDNPFDKGAGWAMEPWAQKEMPVDDELCRKASENSDYALVVIGRTAGEDKDNKAEPESYLLSDEEERLIKTVSKYFPKMCVALNTGNIIDMKWVEKYNVPCVLYCWQGGMEGGNAFADVILGEVSPSGRMPDTIAYDINDYPSTANHGDPVKNVYCEDIYVGYRYFETFAKDKVLYPFGYGLSYTEFNYEYAVKDIGESIEVTANVRNTGKYASKTVVQVYFSAPQCKLGNPVRQLIAYKKTDLINPNESQTITVQFKKNDMASYDDIDTFSYILEKGEYGIYVGENVRDAQKVLSLELEETVVEKLRQNLAPQASFERIKPKLVNGKLEIIKENAPLRKYDISERKREHIISQNPPTGNKGINLKAVKEGKASLDDFIMQLSEKELTCIVKGEGMNSPKVTPGTASVFGGVTDELLSYGIPPVCTTDGPSGIRMDDGSKATLIPNGTCLASSWNDSLIEELYSYIGIELRANNVDALLGPGINIHRNPLNGRNFEYFSEEPYLAGKLAAACIRGLSQSGVSGTIKHFACNSQEYKRSYENAVVSERALREIYLKPFEIAVKEGNAASIMTSYNMINGEYAPANYDLCTSILRDEWGYNGFVMTDWWATLVEGEDRMAKSVSKMVEAQNDVYMVVKSSKDNDDDLMKSVNDGSLNLTHLRKCVRNVLNFILTSPALERKTQIVQDIKRENYDEIIKYENVQIKEEYDLSNADALEIEFMTTGSELAQYVINIFSGNENLTCALTKASTDKPTVLLVKLPEHEKNITLEFSDAFKYMNVMGLKEKAL